MFNNFDTLCHISIYTTQRVVYSIPKQTEQLQKKSVTSGLIRYSNICKHCIKFVNIFPANLLIVTLCIQLPPHCLQLSGHWVTCCCIKYLVIFQQSWFSKKGKSKQLKMGQISLLCFFFNVLKKKRKSIKLKIEIFHFMKKKDTLNNIKVGKE